MVVVGGLNVIDLVEDGPVVARDEGLGLHAERALQVEKSGVTVGAENGLAGRDRLLERVCHFDTGQPTKHAVGSEGLTSRPPHKNWNPVFVPAPAPLGLAAPLARRAGELARTLLRFTEVGLIHLKDAGNTFGLMSDNLAQEAVTPPEGFVQRQPDLSRSLPHGVTLPHALCVGLELVFVPQSRKRCSGRCVEGLAACAAKEALQAVLDTVPHHFLATTPATGARARSLDSSVACPHRLLGSEGAANLL